MKNRFIFLFTVAAICDATFAFTVTGVSAHQRWPWNNLIDIDFNIGGAAADDTFKIDVKASYAGGDRVIAAKTFVTEPIARIGANRVTWDFGTDYPNFKADDLRVAVTSTPFTNGADGVWMVIDLSGGKDATSYPVRYTTTAPVHSVNAPDACKTTEMWLKRIKGGSFMFCRGDAADSTGEFKVNITKDFYMGIFECTQQQWAQITGEWPSAFSNETYRATRPCDTISITTAFGHYMWPDNQTPSASSPIAKMRARSGLATFNLPTEGQWEWANRCGYERGKNPCYTFDQIRYNLNYSGTDFACGLEDGTVCVGTYVPNTWGIYEMFGNVGEVCIDAGVSIPNLRKYYGTTFCGLAEEDCTVDKVVVDDPIGGPISGTYKSSHQYYHVGRGGAWNLSSGYFYHFQRWTNSSENFAKGCRGVRFVVTCE